MRVMVVALRAPRGATTALAREREDVARVNMGADNKVCARRAAGARESDF